MSLRHDPPSRQPPECILMKRAPWLKRMRNPDPPVTRRERILKLVQPAGKHGIEVGALNRPIVTRAEGKVLYADHLSADGLRKKYANDPIINSNNFEDLVHVDIVTGRNTLCDAVNSDDKFDYIVASHVLEHIADPIGWIVGCTRILKEDGIILLALPDRRFTFDRFRVDTTTGELIENYLYGKICPTPAQVFEYNSRSSYCSPTDVKQIWKGKFENLPSIDEPRLQEALRLEIDVVDNNTYLDCHCSIFTPYSFIRIFRELILLGIISLEVAAIEPTREKEAEFFVVLRKRQNASPRQLSSTIPDLDPVRHGQTPAKRLGWRSRPVHALRVLLTGRSQ